MAKQTFSTGQVLTAAQMTSLQQTAMLGGAASAKTASYTLVAADAGSAISMSNASATTITVNTALFAAGDTVHITNLGAGVCTITAGTATVNSSASLALAQYESGFLDFTSTSAAIFVKGAGAAPAISGMTLLNTTTFSAVSSQSIDTLFSSTYQNYFMILNISSVSGTNPNILAYFRSAGADVTTNNNTENLVQYSTTITGAETGSTIEFGRSSAGYSDLSNFSVNIFNPQIARTTTFSSNGGFVTNAGVPYQYRSFGYNLSITQMTGIKIYPSTGTMTGEVSIYGLAK
jgi:hypothetical protein